MSITHITDQFIQFNRAEAAQPNAQNVETYRESQALQDAMSLALRDVFVKHRQFLAR